MPAHPGTGNGALLIDVPNRGRAISHALFNSSRDPMPLGRLDQGIGFLEDEGFTTAVVGWELGQGAELPYFTDADGKTHYVEGVGFAIVRDWADFLATASVDSAGQPNPLAGAVTRSLAVGYSQTGRFLKSALLSGFNMVEGRRVFAGMHIFGAAAGQLPILRSGTGPESSASGIPTFANPEFRGVNEEVLAIADLVGRVRARNEVPPRIAVVNTTTDYMSLRASLARTGGDGLKDLDIPDNVRIYDVAGASHGLIKSADCKLPVAILDWHPVLRATLSALDHWITNNVEPPANQLMPLKQVSDDPMVLQAPSHLPKAIIQVPIRDQDGNVSGGVRLPEMAAPLGTHAGQNPPLSFICMLAASYKPFAKTKEERASNNDQRLSLAERYRDQNDYVNQVRNAARMLTDERLLLPQDAAIIVDAASGNTSFR
jgi:hypothetical protein